MVEIKSHDFDRFAKSNVGNYRLFLVYGPDRGLVSERAAIIAARTGIDLSDPFAMVKLEAADLSGDPGRLIDEVGAFGLFGGKKLIWLRAGGSEKPLVEALQTLANSAPSENILIVEAGDIKKGAGMRKLADAAGTVASISCYADDTKAVNVLIDEELKTAGLTITPAARERLLDALGGDRIASRGEIRKLALYRRGEGTIEEQHVLDIIGDASAISADDAVDAVLQGDIEGLQRAFDRIVASKTPIFMILQSCLRQFQTLDLMRSEMDEKNTQATQIMQTLGRHIHFRRKPIMERALRRWPSQMIAREAARIQSTILKTRQQPALEESTAFHLLMSIALQSSRYGSDGRR
ncbi:DNA polymerase III subunit delta [Neorhizobium sp. NPDC001467]|uniref:DNA polymerase III subunit delta n=1 Tax=Neorhizobium sp. NPDC001467 TaxID=3390595 RepID=UPI003D05239F